MNMKKPAFTAERAFYNMKRTGGLHGATARNETGQTLHSDAWKLQHGVSGAADSAWKMAECENDPFAFASDWQQGRGGKTGRTFAPFVQCQ